MDFVRVVDEKLDLQQISDSVASDQAGAIATFIGTTRDSFQGKRVERLEYEGYVPMAKKEMLRICGCARQQWNLIGLHIAHRLGVCPVGEASVIIAASSAHREEALRAVHYLIDELKASVPIWKLEVYEGDDRVWKENVEARTNKRLMVPAAGGALAEAGVSATSESATKRAKTT